MYPQQFLTTGRLETAYYRAGEENRKKLLLLHGNISSSVFFLPLFPYLSRYYDIAAPDLRCFGKTQDLPVNARRGYRDWCDDIAEFLDALGWKECAVLGWSMGGNVAMQYAMDHEGQVSEMILVAPGSPFGFGGTKDERGTPIYPLGLGCGGGCATPQFLMTMLTGSHAGLRQIVENFFFDPPFRLKREWEEKIMDSISMTRTGRDRYPGDYYYTYQWPFFIAGDRGVLNAISPKYGNVSGFTEIRTKPPILWVRGIHDVIVSDHSMLELGSLGQMGMVPGWPGPIFYPPQPMVAQTRYVLERYKEKGGSYSELILPGGHACVLEAPEMFLSAVCTFLGTK